MEKAANGKICFKLSFLPIILVLVLFSIFLFFPASQSFHSLFIVPIMLLSIMLLFTLTKKKGFPDENLVPEKEQKEELQQLLADATQTEDTQQSEVAQKHEQQIDSHPDSSLPSDSESSDGSILDDNVEFNFLKLDQLQDKLESDYSVPSDSESFTGSTMDESSDADRSKDQYLGIFGSSLVSDSDSDDDEEEEEEEEGEGEGKGEEEEEDSLIEINLPIGNFPGLSEEPRKKILSKLPDFLPESIFNQQGLVELLAEINEVNEDENLIEIDVSMGSSKSQDKKLKQEVVVMSDL